MEKDSSKESTLPVVVPPRTLVRSPAKHTDVDAAATSKDLALLRRFASRGYPNTPDIARPRDGGLQLLDAARLIAALPNKRQPPWALDKVTGLSKTTEWWERREPAPGSLRCFGWAALTGPMLHLSEAAAWCNSLGKLWTSDPALAVPLRSAIEDAWLTRPKDMYFGVRVDGSLCDACRQMFALPYPLDSALTPVEWSTVDGPALGDAWHLVRIHVISRVYNCLECIVLLENDVDTSSEEMKHPDFHGVYAGLPRNQATRRRVQSGT